MAKLTTVTTSVLLVWLAVLCAGCARKTSLRTTLEGTWNSYLEASRSGEESELEKVMSVFRLGMMKNNLASAKRSLTPDLIKSFAEDSPDISTAEFVALLETGPTAGLVYAGDSEEKDADGKPQVTFTFIKFVKEGSEWKVDAVMETGGPKFQGDGKKTEFDPSELPPDFAIDGRVREAPKPITPPYATAFLDIVSQGYETQVIVNDIEQTTTVDSSSSGLLKGGLRKGENNIVIVVAQTEKDTTLKPQVTVRRILENRETKETFKFAPQENVEGRHTFNFGVDN